MTNYNWLFYALLAVLAYGWIDFSYKVAAHKKINSHQLLQTSTLVTAILAFVLFLLEGNFKTNYILACVFAIFDATFFALSTLAKIEALKKLHVALAFPIIKLSTIFVLLFSLVWFHENLNKFQWIGLGVIVLVFGLLWLEIRKGQKHNLIMTSKSGIWLASFAALMLAGSMISNKFATEYVNKFLFMFVSFTLTTTLFTIKNKFLVRNSSSIKKNTGFYYLATTIGALNALGFYFILKALELGKLGIVQGILSTSLAPSIIFSALFLKEKLSLAQIGIVVFACIAIFLLKYQ